MTIAHPTLISLVQVFGPHFGIRSQLNVSLKEAPKSFLDSLPACLVSNGW